jgi:hypothetical protein
MHERLGRSMLVQARARFFYYVQLASLDIDALNRDTSPYPWSILVWFQLRRLRRTRQ